MNRGKRNLINMGLFNILGLIIIFALFHFFVRGVLLSTETVMGTLTVLFAGLVPALIWLSFFYVLDREDPEPTPMVALAFFSGIVGFIVFNRFLGVVIFNTDTWSLNAVRLPIAQTLFVNGVIPAVSIYFIVRYVFYPSKEFDEPVDGMMYGAFAGIGYALTATLYDIFTIGEASLYYLVFSLILRLAIYSSLSAFIGYYFGIARFNPKQTTKYFLYSLVISLLIFCGYAYVNEWFKLDITINSDLVSIGLTLVFSVLLLAITFVLIQRSLKQYDKKKMKHLGFFPDRISVTALIILLTLGIWFRSGYEKDRMFTAPDDSLSFELPVSFQFVGQKDNMLIFSKRIKGERYPMFLKIITFNNDKMSSLIPIKPLNTNLNFGGYDIEKRELQQIVYLDDSRKSAFSANILQLCAYKDNRKSIISIESPAPTGVGNLNLAKRILKSLRWEV
ncbi:PrsW family intramembrane metalloprotease [bacterium]|nr:PrsW family intramembrane metalloprotease [bacterium]